MKRKEKLPFDSVPVRAEMTLAIAGWHELSVNGRRVGDEVLSPVTCQPIYETVLPSEIARERAGAK